MARTNETRASSAAGQAKRTAKKAMSPRVKRIIKGAALAAAAYTAKKIYDSTRKEVAATVSDSKRSKE